MADTAPPQPAPSTSEAARRVREDVATGEVDWVIIGVSDVNGVFRGKRVPASKFAADGHAESHISDLLFGLDIADGFLDPPAGYTGWWPSWERGWDDLTAITDPTTYRRVPWLDRTALVLMDVQPPAGVPVEMAPRSILRRVLQFLPDDRIAYAAPELEFTLLRGGNDAIADSGFRFTPLSAAPACYGVARSNADEHIVRPIRDALMGLGLHVEASGAEASFGQYELNLSPEPALQAADSAFLFKHTVREVANLHDHTATFMAKPIADGFGSSQHVHLSLWSADGVNLFHDPDDEHLISPLAKQFIAGVLATLREFTVLYAPTINSYKRLSPESAAGTTPTWAVQSRSVGVRVVNDTPNGTRVELRTPGADANPYLVLAGFIAGGLHGIDQQLDPGAPYVGNAYSDPSIEPIPSTLEAAADLFERSDVAKHYLGEEPVRYFAASRRIEVDKFRAAVTDWEIERYVCRV